MVNKLLQQDELRTIVERVAEVAKYLWENRWAERNAGNISVNVTSLISKYDLIPLMQFPLLTLPQEYPELAEQLILTTGSGTRMRDLFRNPLDNLGFIFMNAEASGYHLICCGGEETGLKPTSELQTHLAIHRMLLQTNASEKAILHTHVTELIALSHIDRFQSERTLNHLLWGMHPETVLFVPAGVGYVPYHMPGTEKMAQATLKALKNHQVVLWEKHGCLATGKTVLEAFDIIDILAKSAKIYFLVKHTGSEPEGLTERQLKEIRNTCL